MIRRAVLLALLALPGCERGELHVRLGEEAEARADFQAGADIRS